MPRPIKPITLYGGFLGPNPFKIAIILSELDLPYDSKFIDFADLKKPSYESLNPNGRLPTIYDPNTDTTLWESGAIIEYLIETYDTEQTLSFTPKSKESHLARQWLYFQVSGQGPYYGQAVWFKQYHPERVESAVQRYVAEITRVSQVLDKWLQSREWLVGGKISFADLAFVSWQSAAERFFSAEGYRDDDFPNVKAWLRRMTERKKVRELIEAQEKVLREKGPLQAKGGN
ncbi:glutathione S-transferase Ure2-like protein [Aspergillus pseudoustus]|uniref:Glutathione S-transferase Ure2-like protein n=1 Tax=Aspergillus pseudoustus TaxID=1810923 RepID=A0ABR4JVS0_9EURO